MLVADTVVGNQADPGVADRLERADVIRIDVSETERRRSRFRTTAEDGTELGVVVGRDLQDGDVLAADDRLVLVRLEPVEAVVLDFAAATVSPTEAMAVGHAVGNRHWKLAVDGEVVRIPAGTERDRIEEAVSPLLDQGVELRVAEVSPTTFDGAETPAHDHAGHGHSHDQDDHVHHHTQASDAGGDAEG